MLPAAAQQEERAEGTEQGCGVRLWDGDGELGDVAVGDRAARSPAPVPGGLKR